LGAPNKNIAFRKGNATGLKRFQRFSKHRLFKELTVIAHKQTGHVLKCGQLYDLFYLYNNYKP